MRYIYSKHILDRMKERDISKEEIDLLLISDIFKINLGSTQDIDVKLILGYIGEKGIVVVINTKTNKLITVRKMRVSEKKLFKEAKNERETNQR